jgi:SecD/SecF fusion protein
MREERLRGLKLAQAAKNGFERAFWTIFDTNITTLLASIILLNFGTGPVKGFGTTLTIGILTSLFSVLVVTKLLVHFALEKGATEFKMARLATDAKIGWMKLARPGFAISAVAVVLSLGFFFSRPDREKLGIDFLGGFTLTARTEAPQPVDEIRRLIGGIDGTIGQSADVKAVLNSGSSEAGYTRFRITYKLDSDASETETESAQETGERTIREALAGVLLQDPVRIALSEQDGARRASGQLAFEAAHPPADIAAAFAGTGLSDVTVEPVEGQRGVYTFSATAESSSDSAELTTLVANLFRDSNDSAGEQLALATPIPESSIVGSEVSGELRDQAVQAVLLSLFATVLYIRVRFREYAYGFAVVVALLHDVIVSLGALTFANWLGIIEGEISLAMVAAFLTIVGWSQNDTIVIFDRVRENLPRVKGSFKDILDLSFNQTLSRTILTSGTTLLAVIVLFAFNLGTRNVLEGFTFAMVVGIVSGTYSTIFIACPVLHWLETRGSKDGARSQDSAKAA